MRVHAIVTASCAVSNRQSLFPLPHEGTGTRPDTWWIVHPKNWGAIREKKLLRNRDIIVKWMGRVVGAQGQLTQGPNMPSPWTNTNAQKMSFLSHIVALICARVCTQLLQPLAQSLIGSPGTLRPTTLLLLFPCATIQVFLPQPPTCFSRGTNFFNWLSRLHKVVHFA